MAHGNRYIQAIIFLIFFVSCTTSKNPFFSKRSQHEKYADALKNAGLEQSALGKAWFEAAEESLSHPLTVNLPYKETGYFTAANPAATGLLLNVKRGEKINIHLATIPATGIHVFTELWMQTGDKFSLADAPDTSSNQFEDVIKKDAQYILRIQPELLANVEYTVTITSGPSLAFPVDSSGKPNIISYWGVSRDAGARRHEGVDIAAKFRTPALAATDGSIGSVTENNLGGKVVFLFDPKTQNSLYYAHLDSQIVHPGERVKTGDTIGLIGKTGNAIHTVPHLHFGIYTGSGAIDPLPFIDNKKIAVKPITAPLDDLNKWLRASVATSLYNSPSAAATLIENLKKNDAVLITGATDDWFTVQLPNGKRGFVKSNDITNKIAGNEKTKSNTRLLDFPDSTAPAKALIPKDEELKIAGSFDGYNLAEYKDLSGWVLK
jgi:peptidoglycan LD-endopeptidase LytH